jgi:hypothetical protein
LIVRHLNLHFFPTSLNIQENQLSVQRSFKPSSAGKIWDSIAIGASFACLVHCLALPVLIALLPAWSAFLDVPESFHLWLLVLAVPVSLTVLVRAATGKPGYLPLRFGIAGLTLMALGLGVEGEVSEAIVTSVGALLLAFGHILNWRARRPCPDCADV